MRSEAEFHEVREREEGRGDGTGDVKVGKVELPKRKQDEGNLII